MVAFFSNAIAEVQKVLIVTTQVGDGVYSPSILFSAVVVHIDYISQAVIEQLLVQMAK